jgi:superoxide dismutase, Fe-Mn family
MDRRTLSGAIWSGSVSGWVELSKSVPTVVFCACGFHVACKTAVALRDAGFDPKYMKGGHSAWKVIGGP